MIRLLMPDAEFYDESEFHPIFSWIADDETMRNQAAGMIASHYSSVGIQARKMLFRIEVSIKVLDVTIDDDDLCLMLGAIYEIAKNSYPEERIKTIKDVIYYREKQAIIYDKINRLRGQYYDKSNEITLAIREKLIEREDKNNG